MTRGHIGQRLRGVRGIECVREQHGVIHCAAQRDTKPAQNMQSQLPIMHPLGDRRVLQAARAIRA